MSHPRPPRTLVVHPGALGDVLQAVPALAALSERGHRLTFAGQPRLARFLADTGVVEAGISFDGLGLEALFVEAPIPELTRARLAAFDRVISWFGARAALYPDRLRALVPEALLAPPVPEAATALTVWEHLLATLAPWGVIASGTVPSLRLPAGWREEARQVLAGLGADGRGPLLTVHPGAGGAWKRWPSAKLAAAVERVFRQTGAGVIVHQGPADAESARELLADLAERAPAVRALRLVDPALDLLAGVLVETAAYLGADSGVSHLAAAVGAHAVILFPAVMLETWAPWSATARPLAMTEDARDVDRAAHELASMSMMMPERGVEPSIGLTPPAPFA